MQGGSDSHKRVCRKTNIIGILSYVPRATAEEHETDRRLETGAIKITAEMRGRLVGYKYNHRK